MAIEKMKLLRITGPEKQLDSFIARNLLDRDIQIEDAKKVYNKSWKFEYYDYDYTVNYNIKKCKSLIEQLDILYREEYNNMYVESTVEQIAEKLDAIEKSYNDLKNGIEDRQKEKEKKLSEIASVEKINDLDIDMSKIYYLKYMKFRYGNIPNEKLDYVKQQIENMNVILYEIEKKEDITWIAYITTTEFENNIDVFFNMQNFERVWINSNISGKPKEYIDNLYKQISDKNNEMLMLQNDLKEFTENCRHLLLSSYRQLQTYEKINKIKKYIMHDSKNMFYIVAWVPESELNNMMDKLEVCQNIDYQIEEKTENKSPTKLKNSRFIKPFELLVKMYGVPNSHEIDPTFFVAITAFFMFGFMFGDVGHGLVFLIFGILLRKKNKDFGDILIYGGVASMIFGFLYGSIFGKEDVLKQRFISPMEDINTMLVYGIVVGCVFIFIAMLLNIINGIRNKDFKQTFLDGNGIAGLALYSFVLFVVAYYFLKGKMVVPTNVIVCVVVVLIALILFNDKLTKIVTRKKEEAEAPVVEKIFEIIEMLLSFASNTISFLRLAAFAINHVGLCMAIYLLANMTNGAGNIIISIIGNIVVLVLEGLIVGIQILRLEYYELFSRFYKGDGIEYHSIRSQTSE